MLKRLIPAYALALSGIAAAGCSPSSTKELPEPVVCAPQSDKVKTIAASNYLRKDSSGNYSAINESRKDVEDLIIPRIIEGREIINVTAEKFTAGGPCAVPQLSLTISDDEFNKAKEKISATDYSKPGYILIVSFNNAAADNRLPLYKHYLATSLIDRMKTEKYVTADGKTIEAKRFDVGARASTGEEDTSDFILTQDDVKTIEKAGAIAFYYPHTAVY